jgi:hypothetical protein
MRGSKERFEQPNELLELVHEDIWNVAGKKSYRKCVCAICHTEQKLNTLMQAPNMKLAVIRDQAS